MKPEVATYLHKARQSLAAAASEIANGRYNSSGSRAYYAAFQAAVALLIEYGTRPRGNSWEHKYVLSEFSGRLIARRNVLPDRFKGSLSTLLELRIVADYKERSLSRQEALDMHLEAAELVQAAAEQLGD